MTRVILIDPCKDERWDRFVESHPFGWVCHLSGWKRVLENSFPHMKGYYLALIDDNGEIKAGLPIYEVRSKLTRNRLVSIPFATLSDPLVSNSEELELLIEATKFLSKNLDISNIEIRTTNCHVYLNNKDFLGQYYFKIHYIDLSLSIEELWKSFHRKAIRQEINRAIQSNLDIKIGVDRNDLFEFYKLYIETRKRLGLPPHPYNFIKLLWEEFKPSKKLFLYKANYKNQTIASHIVFRFNGRVSAEFEGWDRNFHKLSANPFLFWEEIKAAKNDGFKVYDFGRTSPKNESLMKFKNHWGTKVSDLPIFYFNNNHDNKMKLNEEKFIYNLTRKVCRRIPTPILKKIGNICYKHLG